MDEWVKNMDWALFVAVLSLLFTGVVSFITIKYTKSSLDYTKESTRIAEESLQAAQKSIDTSIELYEKQKKDSEMKRDIRKKERLSSLKYLVSSEISINSVIYSYTVTFCKRVIEDSILDLKVNDDDSNVVSYMTRDFCNSGFVFTKHESSVTEKYLLDIVDADSVFYGKIIKMLIEIKRYNDLFIPKLRELINKTDYGDDNMKLYFYLKESEKFIVDYHFIIAEVMRYCLNLDGADEQSE